ncbi:MAG: TerB family tellurite resistance protein [Vicingaceae bacterium]
MARYGKWIGGGLGWAFAGPIGALLGYAIGTMFDNANKAEYEQLYSDPKARQRTKTGDFSVSMLVLAAAVMKADGKVLKAELDYVKKFMVQQFGVEKTKEQMKLFKEILGQDIPLRDVCLQIKHFTIHADRLQLVHFLFGISASDQHFDRTEVEVINRISQLLGISEKDYQSIKAMFIGDSDADYKILEISASASNDEVKKAYRKMAVKYHPDKVNHLGEDFQKMAKEKFQSVQRAYSNIKKSRGLS